MLLVSQTSQTTRSAHSYRKRADYGTCATTTTLPLETTDDMQRSPASEHYPPRTFLLHLPFDDLAVAQPTRAYDNSSSSTLQQHEALCRPSIGSRGSEHRTDPLVDMRRDSHCSREDPTSTALEPNAPRSLELLVVHRTTTTAAVSEDCKSKGSQPALRAAAVRWC